MSHGLDSIQNILTFWMSGECDKLLLWICLITRISLSCVSELFYLRSRKQKQKPKKETSWGKHACTYRCTHHTHSPSSHTFSLVFFSEFMSMNSIKVAENSVCVCMNSALNKWRSNILSSQKETSKQLKKVTPVSLLCFKPHGQWWTKILSTYFRMRRAFHRWVNGNFSNIASG